MQIFLDTADVAEIARFADMGLVDGVTTNPSLMAKEDGDPAEILRRITQLVPGDVSAEVVATDTEGMVREGREFAAIAKNIVVKCPLTPEGLRAVRDLATDAIRVNVTLCFSVPQALFAAKAGAYIVSPFVGRLDDIATPGMQLIADIREVYKNYGFATKTLVASIRNPLHVVDAVRLGADIATLPPKVLDLLIRHPLTTIGLQRFLDDWREAQANRALAAAAPGG